MAGRVRDQRKQCDVPGCVLLGRLYPKGWRCDVHGHTQPKPDPNTTATGLLRTSRVTAISRTVTAALEAGATEADIAEALAVAWRRHELASL